MNRLVLFVFALFTSASVATAQCNTYYQLSEGSEWEYESFNAKGKLTGKNLQKVTSLKETPNGFEAVIHSVMSDQKGKEVAKTDLSYKCENGTVFIDMRNLVSEEQLKAYKDADMKIETENLELPSGLSAGQTLKDGKITMSASGGPIPMKMTITISDRKVVGKESITTPAGTFDAFKITSKMTMQNQMGMTITTEMATTEWIAEKVGSVKSETYAKNGKLAGSTVLSKRQN